MTVRIWGDFNSIVPPPGDRRMPLVTDWRLAIGDSVLVYDGEGNECHGVVVKITSWGCYAAMDLSTWKDRTT